MVIRGTSLGMLWTPSQNKNNAHALIGRKHLRIVILGLAIPMAIRQQSQPSLMWLLFRDFSFRRLRFWDTTMIADVAM